MAHIQELSVMSGVFVVTMQTFQDARGAFTETYRREWFSSGREMLQSNRSVSVSNVLRGLHYHRYQADFWVVPQGRVLVALADIRLDSPTFLKTYTCELGQHQSQVQGVYIPRGIAHGFYAYETSTMTYMVDNYYNPEDERGVIWNDASLDIAWPSKTPILSPRDLKNPSMAEILQVDLVRFSDSF